MADLSPRAIHEIMAVIGIAVSLSLFVLAGYEAWKDRKMD